MRSNTLLLFSILTLIFYSEKWLCLGETAACGTTIPFNVSVGLNEALRIFRFDEGCVTNKSMTEIKVISPVEVFEEGTFVDLPLLSVLSLTGIGIRELKPGFIKNVPKLTSFHLFTNQIKFIQTDVFGGTRRFNDLESLSVSDNKISQIEKAAFSNFTAAVLILARNQLSSVGDWFGNTSLEELVLSDNSITFLKKGAFDKIQTLRAIWLNGNRIQFIETGTFTQGVMDLIDLSHNLLYNIDFVGESLLRLLDISYNKISNLQLSEKTKIEKIIIYPNPWNCRCLHKFWKLAWKRGIDYISGQRYGANNTVLVCIYREECNEHYIDTQLQEEYSKNFKIYT